MADSVKIRSDLSKCPPKILSTLLTAYYIKSVETNCWEKIEMLTFALLKVGNEDLTLTLHNFSEMFQNLEVE